MHARPPGSEPLVVGGIEVHAPVTAMQAERLSSCGLLADTPDGLARAWDQMERTWAATVARARELPDEMLSERVNGEWSFAETLRHLVMVTDAWLRRMVLQVDSPFHPCGLTPHFIPNPSEMGIDVDARPSFDEVLAIRAERVAQVRDFIRKRSGQDLNSQAGDGPFTTVGALQVIVFEEWAHHEFATRDLAQLEATSRG